MKNNKKLYLWFISIMLTAILAACTSSNTPDLDLAGTYAAQTLAAMAQETEVLPTSTPTMEPSPTPEPILEAVGPFDFPENVNPLTGLVVSDPAILDRRPVLVKVANYPASGR